MPIYEYDCPTCGEFEVTQRITDSPLRRCPSCRSRVRKLISSTSFQLKGSGWYLTDYARKDGGTKEKAPGGKAESAGDAKTESKSEAKSAGESPPSSKPSKGEGAQAA